jgi:hypothetical protein
MKKILTILGLMLFGITKAQLPVTSPFPNVPSTAIDINKYSFYIDSVSSLVEQNQSFTASGNNTIAALSINLIGTTAGVHQLYARVINTSGQSSIINVGNFYKAGPGFDFQNTPTIAANINAYKFYVDSVTNVNEQPVNFTAAANNNIPAQTINIASAPAGVHQLYARVLNTAGQSSIINVGNFYKAGAGFDFQNIPIAAININKYSFYVDSVTTVNEQPVSFTASSNNNLPAQTIDITTTPAGVHQLYAKVVNTAGQSSILNVGNFYKTGPGFNFANAPLAAENINKYEFYIDSVTSTNAQPLSFTAAANNTTANNSINLAGVLPGVHQLYARVFDVNNKASIVNVRSFNMDQIFRYPNVPVAAPAINTMEYFIDTDPGFGNATPITFTPSTNISNLNFAASGTSSLSSGTHYIFIRSKQNPWSETSIVPFTVDGVVPLKWQYISAVLQDKNGLIKWGTATEVSTKEFIVEHSTDARSFASIGVQSAAGNSNTTSNYNFTHLNLPVGLNYYRIKQIDLDGSFSYSAVVTLLNKNGLKNNILAPNPATNYSLLVFAKPTYQASIRIINTNGAIVSNYKIGDGNTQFNIDVTKLSAGVYTVEILNNNQKESISLLKK